MKNNLLKPDIQKNPEGESIGNEEIPEIHRIVEDLLASIEKTKGQKKNKSRSNKKWKKNPKKPNQLDDFGIRDLPLTF